MTMDRLTENKLVLVKRKTRLEELIAKYNTIEQAKFYIEHLGSDFSDYISEDERYKLAVSDACNGLEQLGRMQVVDRDFVPNYIFGPEDIVVVIGQDGLVANTMKYLDSQPLIGVNPDPCRWDGILLPFKVPDLSLIVQDVFRGRRKVKEVSMAKAVLNDGQSIYAVNDLFIGQRTHVSSRYRLSVGNRQEFQSSSGIIVSTGLGSTGWLKSILTGAINIADSVNGAINIAGNVTGEIKSMGTRGSGSRQTVKRLDWDIDYLLFSVREPFPSKTTKADIVFGKVNESCPLKIVSQMPENGVIFSDGIESDYLRFTSGIEATISVAEKRGHLVV